MGGILGGLIGGLIKGSTGGLTAEGERLRKEENYQKNLLTQMHINALSDWENLSPQAQEGHVKSLENIWGDKKGIFRSGINLVHSIRPHLTPPADPVTGKPAPYLDDPLGEIAQQSGLGGPETRSFNQNKMLQEKLYNQNYAEAERKRKLAAIQAIPEVPGGKERLVAEVETGRPIPQVPQETYEDVSLDVPGQGTVIAQRGVHSGRYFIDDPTGRKPFNLPAGTKFTPKSVTQRPPMNEEGYAAKKEIELGRPLTAPERLAIHKEWMAAGTQPTVQFMTDQTGRVSGAGITRGPGVGSVSPIENAGDMRKTSMAPTELDKRTAIKNMTDLLDLVENQAKAHPDYLGLMKGKGYRLKRWAGIETDPIANDIYGGMADVKEALIRAKEGAVIPDAMYRRLDSMLPSPDQAPEKFWADMRRFKITMANALGVRGMEAPPTSAAPQSTTGTSVKVRNKKTGQTGSIPQAKLKAALASGQYEEVR